MPTSEQTAGGLGIVDRWPAAATGIARYVASQAGVEPTPENLVKTMHSDAFGATALRAARDKRLAERIYSQGDKTIAAATTPPVLPNQNAPAEQQATDVYSMRENASLSGIRARNVINERLTVAADKFNKLADFDSDSYMRKRLKDENPTSDIDDRVLNLRIEAITAKAYLRNQYKDLDPSLRNQIIAGRMQVFSDTIDTLKEIRDSRLTSAKSRIQDEIDSKNDMKRSAQSTVNALKGMMDNIEQTGNDVEALGKIRMEYLKEVKKLGKAKGDVMPDDVETIYNALLDEITKPKEEGGLGEVPDSDQKAEALRKAKQHVANRKKAKEKLGKSIPGGSAGGLNVLNLPVLAPIRVPTQFKEPAPE